MVLLEMHRLALTNISPFLVIRLIMEVKEPNMWILLGTKI